MHITIVTYVYDRFVPLFPGIAWVAGDGDIDYPQTFAYRGTIDVSDVVSVDEILADLFERHNRDDRPDGRLCPSMSVGDLIRLWTVSGLPQWYRVDGAGFSRVAEPEEHRLMDTPWVHLSHRAVEA